MAQTDAKSGSTKKILFLVVVIIAVALAVAGHFIKDRKIEKKIITTGDRAPDFSLASLNGRSISLADLRGKIVMVHFWATWCPPCVEELPTLAKLYEELKGGDFEMLAVSVDEGGGAAVEAFLKKNSLTLPVFLDPGGSVSRLYGTYKFPETYILDRQGSVRYKVIGPRDWRDPEALRALRELIAAR
ncbi:MAG TPA: TlpA disulfide reductase family protein [Nitrospirota bacterium]|nr:TlpA disulfide reductase family protein [Nitrospirota bacterium]